MQSLTLRTAFGPSSIGVNKVTLCLGRWDDVPQLPRLSVALLSGQVGSFTSAAQTACSGFGTLHVVFNFNPLFPHRNLVNPSIRWQKTRHLGSWYRLRRPQMLINMSIPIAIGTRQVFEFRVQSSPAKDVICTPICSRP